MSSKIRSKVLKVIIKAPMNNEINDLYEFGEFKFDGNKGKLWQKNDLILLSPKATELLALLLEKKGEFVDKQEIFETVWKDTFVEDGVLTQNIYTLRKALGNDADGLPIIENKTRLGYRITVAVFCDAEMRRNEDAEIGRRGDTEKIQITPIDNESVSPKIPTSPRRSIAASILIAVAVIAIAAIGYRYFRPQIVSYLRKPIESVKFTQLTNTSDLASATLSPDGNFLAYIRQNKIYLKDIGSNKEIPLQIPNVPSFRSLQFSADGNFLYFCNNSAYNSGSKILKVSRFGGDTELIVEKNQGLFSLSPDNKFLAYYSAFISQGLKLIIRNLETGNEHEILQLDSFLSTVTNNSSLSWSPDGKRILSSTQSLVTAGSQLFMIDVETGTSNEIKIPKLRRFQEAHWLADNENFVLSATENGRTYHLWKVYYSNGDIQPLTTGLNSFEKPVLSADGKKMLALQTTNNSNLYTATDVKLTEQKQLTTGNTNKFGQTSLTWTNDQEILFSSQLENDSGENIWLIDSNGNGKRQITSEKEASPSTAISDGKSIFYTVIRNQFANVERIDVGGGNLSKITNGNEGQRRSPQISPDGSSLYYILRDAKGSKIMRLNLLNQKEEIWLEDEKVRCGLYLKMSPDGKYFACPNWRQRTSSDNDKHNAELAIISTETKSAFQYIPIERISANFHFSPDSKAIEFISAFESGTQIMRQAFNESEPKSILSMPNDRIFNFAWSKNGKNITISRGQQVRDAVLLTDFQ
jgi:DNA-binding winged helix-turn-helix (wHTH) protein/Tol biopolymer transport system component